MSRLNWKVKTFKNKLKRHFERNYKGVSDIIGIILAIGVVYNLARLIQKLIQFYRDFDLLDYTCIVNLFISAILLELSIQAFNYGRHQELTPYTKVLKEEVIQLTDIEIAIARYIATNPSFGK